ncbi:MAG: hypothetical protein Fur0024_4970 [Patescibacteria group bacterium]
MSEEPWKFQFDANLSKRLLEQEFETDTDELEARGDLINALREMYQNHQYVAFVTGGGYGICEIINMRIPDKNMFDGEYVVRIDEVSPETDINALKKVMIEISKKTGMKVVFREIEVIPIS